MEALGVVAAACSGRVVLNTAVAACSGAGGARVRGSKAAQARMDADEPRHRGGDALRREPRTAGADLEAVALLEVHGWRR